MVAGTDTQFIVTDFMPAYLDAGVRALLPQRVEAALAELACCCACPRNCRADRLSAINRDQGSETPDTNREQGSGIRDQDGRDPGHAGRRSATQSPGRRSGRRVQGDGTQPVREARPPSAAVCNTGRHAIVASAFPHFGEEDCLRGVRGSGTIFFSMCNLRCVFCQNWDISQRRSGREMSADRIADLMLSLQEQGCHNVNFVTPEHVVPQCVEAIALAVERGLRVPIVYNTSAYDSLESLRLMEGLVDIYMPDFKFWSSDTARRLAKAKDYPQRARDAIREMHRQVGVLKMGPDGLARRGVLVRHLVMPGQLDETRAIFQWLAGELSPDTYVNIMGQYRPAYEVGELVSQRRQGGESAQVSKYAEVNRGPYAEELRDAYSAARQAGLWRFDDRRSGGLLRVL